MACSALSLGKTTIRLAAGTVEKPIPVTVKSSNLLAYGPASANGLTATVTDDGFLHVKGQTATAHKGLEWRLPNVEELRGRTVTLAMRKLPEGVYVYVHLAGANNTDLGNILTSSPTVRIPDETQSMMLRVATNTTSPVEGDIAPTLNFGDTALAWMRPDDTSLEGGGMS